MRDFASICFFSIAALQEIMDLYSRKDRKHTKMVLIFKSLTSASCMRDNFVMGFKCRHLSVSMGKKGTLWREKRKKSGKKEVNNNKKINEK